MSSYDAGSFFEENMRARARTATNARLSRSVQAGDASDDELDEALLEAHSELLTSGVLNMRKRSSTYGMSMFAGEYELGAVNPTPLVRRSAPLDSLRRSSARS